MMAQDTSIEGYRMLAYAIIAQASSDYVECLKFVMFNGRNPSDEVDKRRSDYCMGQIRNNESFFRSPRFDILADRDMDGEALIELLNKRAASEYKQALEDPSDYLKKKDENTAYIRRMSGIHKKWGKKSRKKYDYST